MPELDTRVSVAEVRISDLKADINGLGRRIESGQAKTDEKIEKVEEKLDVELGKIRRGLWVAAATFASLAVGIFTLIAQSA